ncbi:hypothetical protein M422DRAFT_251902 [Sphaerobolus stellatus SS14]|uniref:Uncharacterized protein n=1 Tax=Sphaerobolus stellatus (strain SS14) TaxID=990650 RepID=A0A0C9VZS0_SPHS4|nr:hypothetical protein M422DRAFT_251902 [Sphaerobolus stellatus SS14]
MHQSEHGTRSSIREAPSDQDESSGTSRHLGINVRLSQSRQIHSTQEPRLQNPQASSALPTRSDMSTQPNNGNTPSGEGPHGTATNNLQNENDALRARIAILEAKNQSLPQPFVADEFETMRSRATGLREEEKKAAVPEMVPGFRANPLTHGE